MPYLLEMRTEEKHWYATGHVHHKLMFPDFFSYKSVREVTTEIREQYPDWNISVANVDHMPVGGTAKKIPVTGRGLKKVPEIIQTLQRIIEARAKTEHALWLDEAYDNLDKFVRFVIDSRHPQTTDEQLILHACAIILEGVVESPDQSHDTLHKFADLLLRTAALTEYHIQMKWAAEHAEEIAEFMRGDNPMEGVIISGDDPKVVEFLDHMLNNMKEEK